MEMSATFNKENFCCVLDYIESHPTEWQQSSWHSPCRTTACFAGRAQIMSGAPINNEATTVRRDARIFLGLTKHEADYLFASHRTLEDFKAFGNGDGYDCAGYNRAGYDRDGLDNSNQQRA
jgi:hypothetical protein